MAESWRHGWRARLGAHAALLVVSGLCMLPLLWMVSTSLKTDEQIFVKERDGTAPVRIRDILPTPVRWRNYPDALRAAPFGTYLQNTLWLCAVTVLGGVFASAVVAYGFAKTRFRGQRTLFVVMLSTLMLPPQVTMIPTFILFSRIGWYNTFLPLTVPAFCGVPFYIFLMTQFFRTIPEELSEAARIDGCSEWRIFWSVILPQSAPVLTICSLFQFLGTWNDFLGPLIYVNTPTRYTLAYGLQQFLSSYGGQWSRLMAGAMVFTLPIVLLFFLAQKTFIQGIATTGFK